MKENEFDYEEDLAIDSQALDVEWLEQPQLLMRYSIASAPNIEAFYREHQDHIDAKDELIESEYQAAVIRSAVFAFNQRKVALEELVRLHGMQYFAGPKAPRDLNKEWKTHLEEKGDERTADKMKAKKAGKKRNPRKRKGAK